MSPGRTFFFGIAFTIVVIAGACSDSEPVPGVAREALSALTPFEQVQAACAGDYTNEHQCMTCVARAVAQLRQSGVITKGTLVSAFVQPCSAHCIPTSCTIASKNCGSFSDLCGGTLDCGTCSPPAICGGGGIPNVCGQPPSCSDNVKNGNETDVDCGGGTCPACPVGGQCAVGADCTSGLCVGGICQ
ncbi:hypothetical protein WME95_24940 [Sorangium sp. So ce327]|jgi:hypothetical protein|uniref:hypothetical protein n=1 Tax=Sorangium sp. So ce327 TaxID=3133301 RepID=UPI003F623C61